MKKPQRLGLDRGEMKLTSFDVSCILEMLAALPRMTIVSFFFFYFSLYLDEYEQMLWSLRRWQRVVFF